LRYWASIEEVLRIGADGMRRRRAKEESKERRSKQKRVLGYIWCVIKNIIKILMALAIFNKAQTYFAF
jgi:hypothetical protein